MLLLLYFNHIGTEIILIPIYLSLVSYYAIGRGSALMTLIGSQMEYNIQISSCLREYTQSKVSLSVVRVVSNLRFSFNLTFTIIVRFQQVIKFDNYIINS